VVAPMIIGLLRIARFGRKDGGGLGSSLIERIESPGREKATRSRDRHHPRIMRACGIAGF